MRRSLSRALLGLWLLAATVALVRFWYARPEAFPALLRQGGNALIDAVAPAGAEAAADLELLYLVLLAFAAVALVTGLGLAVWKRFKGDRPAPRPGR
ncbi:hypothetical protein [Eleftheria terrae]|uniref:hypothetical protein n=1 Tax=Eleftheria terrae TaxID=1597781 RepID=UPI00263BD8BD|nr:hypothetical protein [Eleftheria terrae]WKB52594.1 hypothetical protein N7L95_22860 [Eleftheria terrae]